MGSNLAQGGCAAMEVDAQWYPFGGDYGVTSHDLGRVTRFVRPVANLQKVSNTGCCIAVSQDGVGSRLIWPKD